MAIQHIERTVNPANERINKHLQSFQSGVISPHCSRRSYQDNCVSMSAFRVLLHASSCTYKARQRRKKISRSVELDCETTTRDTLFLPRSTLHIHLSTFCHPFRIFLALERELEPLPRAASTSTQTNSNLP